MEKPQPNPFLTVVMSKLQDREAGEAAKLSALHSICVKLDKVLAELEALHQVADELAERARKP